MNKNGDDTVHDLRYLHSRDVDDVKWEQQEKARDGKRRRRRRRPRIQAFLRH
jgi:hypothetical protein